MRSIAEVVSRCEGVRVLEINHDVLLSRFIGEGEKKLRQVFKDADRYYAMLLH